MKKNRPVIPPTKAIAQSDIEVLSDGKTLYSCKKGDIITFKEIVYKDNGNGYLVVEDEIELKLGAFKVIN